MNIYLPVTGPFINPFAIDLILATLVLVKDFFDAMWKNIAIYSRG